jgi:hypothetical protein
VTAKRHEHVAAHEPRVVEQDRVRREHQRERDGLVVAQAPPESERREGEQPADEGDGEAGAEVRGAQEREDRVTHDRKERTVDDRSIGELARLVVAQRPVGDTGLVEVHHPAAEADEPGGEREDGQSDDGERGSVERTAHLRRRWASGAYDSCGPSPPGAKLLESPMRSQHMNFLLVIQTWPLVHASTA